MCVSFKACQMWFEVQIPRVSKASFLERGHLQQSALRQEKPEKDQTQNCGNYLKPLEDEDMAGTEPYVPWMMGCSVSLG